MIFCFVRSLKQAKMENKIIKQIEHLEEQEKDGTDELNKKHYPVEVPSKQDYVATYKKKCTWYTWER